MSLGEKIVNIRGITAVILMVGINVGLAIIGMVIIAVIHDGDIAPGVVNNLQLIAATGIGVAGTLIAHYIGTAGQTQQQQQQIVGQAQATPTVTVPVAVTPVAAPAAGNGV
ncbi:MAG TPA: hypothetical protein VKQ30_03240 [Ktedonobacterales bacterium]|nr:hypothetical protein [Ktedonobacterales bacterium]